LQELLKTHFGFSEFRPLQKEIVTNVLAGEDTFVLMPTGGGKSLCYQLPALKLPGITLVISPLIALMKDQVDSLKQNGIKAEFINSSLPPGELAEIHREAIAGEIKILYLAPERIATRGFKDFLKQLNVSLLAIDEAHCISEWGHDFRPDYRNLSSLKELINSTSKERVPTIALTATATTKVRQDIIHQLNLTTAKQFISSFNRENLSFIVMRKRQALEKIIALLQKHQDQSAIIYCFSRKDTENLAADLEVNGIKALAYHAGLDNLTRKQNQEQFIKDEVQVMVATIAFGMGIDKPDVRLIVHHSFPKSLEGYYQETGRAGRDGLASECVLLYSAGDRRKHEFFLTDLPDLQLKNAAEQKLDEVMGYAESKKCRRKMLLNYFGEQYQRSNCAGCDICLDQTEFVDGTIIAQKILSCVIRTGSRFGKNYIADVLIGSKKKQVLQNGHTSLSVYGIVSDYTASAIRDIIDYLVDSGLLEKTFSELPTLVVSPEGLRVLTERSKVQIPKLKSAQDELRATKKTKKELDYAEDLFNDLRILRQKIAQKLNLPPFVIFNDVSLQEMAYYLPPTLAEFGLIRGVSQKKAATFGQEFIKIITDYLAKTGKSPKSDQLALARKSTNGRVKKAKKARFEKTRLLVEKQKSLESIAQSQGLKVGTIINHLEKLVDTGEQINLEYLRPQEADYQKIKAAFEELSSDFLRPVYDYFEEQYSYEQLRLVRLIIAAQDTHT
jgi:ATP-dependent DNA helicase RecQ